VSAGDSTHRVARFGPFTLDLRTRELSKDGVRLRLHGIPVEVLAALVERAGDLVTRRELRERLWAEDTFVDYQNSLNSAMARLREALGDAADRPRYVETLPKRGYRFVAAVTVEDAMPAPADTSLPFDGGLTLPEQAVSTAPNEFRGVPAAGTERPAGIHEAQATRPLEQGAQEAVVAAPRASDGAMRIRRVAVVAAGVAALGVLLAVIPALRRPEAPAPRVMLAVLPFDNMTGLPEQDYVSDGFTEEIITQLARVNPERVGVIARTTAMNYKGAGKPVAEIGRELSVDYVLEGSVRGGQGALRVTAQLIRVADQSHVWAETFDRTAASLLELERDVSAAVSRQVHALVGPLPSEDVPGRRPHADAYAAYLRARYYHAQATVQGIERAIESYRAAVGIDPEYALAHAGLARAYIFGVRTRPADALRQAHESALAALALEPELPEAQLAVAMTKLYYEWDWAGSAREFQRAIGSDPGSADARFYYSHLLAATGRHDEAIAEARRAQQLDPHSTLIGHYVGRHLFMARRYDEAVRELQRTLELDPNYGWSHMFTFITYEKMRRWDEALRHRQKYLSLIGRSPSEVSDLAARFATTGHSGVLEKWMEMTLEYAERSGHVTSAELVHGYAALGRTDEAFRWLDRAFDDHTRDLIYLAVDPGYDPLRRDARYTARLQQMHLGAAAAAPAELTGALSGVTTSAPSSP
jgi:TolB-like protein/DNA-binding winged helix-turn-helix (wHTH) protein